MAERRFYVNKENINENEILLKDNQHNHLRNVLRLNEGDDIIVVCGDGFDYHAKIISIDKNKTNAKVLSVKENKNDANVFVTVFQPLIKKDNLYLVIEKLTELGVTNFVPFNSAFSTVKEKAGKLDKLEAISQESIKQCKRSKPMIISDTKSFKEVLVMLKDYDIVIFANETETKNNLKELKLSNTQRIAIIVGSEGGFKNSEIADLTKAGAKSIGLGKRILRAETAAILLSGLVMYEINELN